MSRKKKIIIASLIAVFLIAGIILIGSIIFEGVKK